jgi:hypothetical protein
MIGYREQTQAGREWEPLVEVGLRTRRRRAGSRNAEAAARYAALGWPVCPGAFQPDGNQRSAVPRSCSCDRMGCPLPAAHPVSPAWQNLATTDPSQVSRWWAAGPAANVILVTGRTFDVLDVPAAAAAKAMASMERSRIGPGPVAVSPGDRAYFFVRTRGAPEDESEWWPCHLDNEPEYTEEVAGLRWHCRNSYVLAPPSRAGGVTLRWLREPAAAELPDGLVLLETLADACEEISS